MSQRVKFKPWMLPLLVGGLVIPLSAAFALLGPFFAFLVAGLLAVVVTVVAVLLGEGPPPVWVRRRRSRREAARSGRSRRG